MVYLESRLCNSGFGLIRVVPWQEPGAERLARQRRGSGFRLDNDLSKNMKIGTNKSGNVPAELATQTELRAGVVGSVSAGRGQLGLAWLLLGVSGSTERRNREEAKERGGTHQQHAGEGPE